MPSKSPLISCYHLLQQKAIITSLYSTSNASHIFHRATCFSSRVFRFVHHLISSALPRCPSSGILIKSFYISSCIFSRRQTIATNLAPRNALLTCAVYATATKAPVVVIFQSGTERRRFVKALPFFFSITSVDKLFLRLAEGVVLFFVSVPLAHPP